MISREKTPPYDRPKLSKALTSKVDDILLRPYSFYEEANIELMLDSEVSANKKILVSVLYNRNQQVVDVDASARTVTVKGQKMHYDYLVAATGGVPRRLQCPVRYLGHRILKKLCSYQGSSECDDLIYYLRTPEDANNIAEAAAGKRVLIIGSSFIGKLYKRHNMQS